MVGETEILKSETCLFVSTEDKIIKRTKKKNKKTHKECRSLPSSKVSKGQLYILKD